MTFELYAESGSRRLGPYPDFYVAAIAEMALAEAHIDEDPTLAVGFEARILVRREGALEVVHRLVVDERFVQSYRAWKQAKEIS